MKKSMIAAALLLGAVVGTAEALVDDAYYSLKELPKELTATIAAGKDIDFKLEEKASSGYVWSAVYDPRECRVQFEYKGSRSKLAGASGYVEVEVKPLKAGPCEVVLNYSRPFEPDKAPAKSVKCRVLINELAPEQLVPVAATDSDELKAVPVTAEKDVAVKDAVEIPPKTPVLADDSFLRLDKVPEAVQATLSVGRDLDFDLQEEPEKMLYWTVGTYDPALCRVELKHDDDDDFLESMKAEIEIEALAPGIATVEFHYGAGTEYAKTFRVYLNQKTSTFRLK